MTQAFEVTPHKYFELLSMTVAIMIHYTIVVILDIMKAIALNKCLISEKHELSASQVVSVDSGLHI